MRRRKCTRGVWRGHKISEDVVRRCLTPIVFAISPDSRLLIATAPVRHYRARPVDEPRQAGLSASLKFSTSPHGRARRRVAALGPSRLASAAECSVCSVVSCRHASDLPALTVHCATHDAGPRPPTSAPMKKPVFLEDIFQNSRQNGQNSLKHSPLHNFFPILGGNRVLLHFY